MNKFHTPVLLKEVIKYLDVGPEKKYIDATLGGGGHAREVLELGGIVLGIDVDEEALKYVQANFKFQISNFKLKVAKGNFRDIDKIARLNGFEKVSGILFDLGVSSYQLTTSERGFSFQREGPLDMRMDKDLGVRAADLINALSKRQLYELFTKMGEERFARPISDNIIRARRVRKIETTMDLSCIIQEEYGRNLRNIHPATRVFQALRIAVNDEINSLKEALPKAIDLLDSKGRIVAISFHSLEDRIVKDSFREFQERKQGTILIKKPITPENGEIQSNSRARSAKLRVFQKNPSTSLKPSALRLRPENVNIRTYEKIVMTKNA